MARPKLLYFLHNYHNRAGTEEHVKTLSSELKADFEIAFIFPTNGQVILRVEDSGEELSFGGEPVEAPFFVKKQPVVNAAIFEALSSFSPNLIHIHHIFNWPMNAIETVLDFAASKGIKTLLTFHDYFFLTPIFTMQGVNTVAEAMSENYSMAAFQKDIREFLKQRQDYFRNQFKRVDTFIAPSEFAARAIGEIFKLEFKVIPHGITPFKTLKKKQVRTHAKLRFGYVGSLLPQKGWQELLKAWAAAEVADSELHLYGGSQVPNLLPQQAFYHGVYNQPDLPQILSEIDIGIIPSVFPETFSIVLSEMQQAGLPVIGTSFGALPERITVGKTGWIVNPYQTLEFSKLFKEIYSNRSWESWEIPIPKRSSEMAKDYTTLYSSS